MLLAHTVTYVLSRYKNRGNATTSLDLISNQTFLWPVSHLAARKRTPYRYLYSLAVPTTWRVTNATWQSGEGSLMSGVRRTAVRYICSVERSVAAALIRVWRQLVCCVKCILFHCGSKAKCAWKYVNLLNYNSSKPAHNFHIFSFALVGFINVAKHQCMAMKYLKLYSTFPSPFLGWMPSPLCLKYEPVLCCNANRPEYNSATVAACVCYRACRRKERRRKC